MPQVTMYQEGDKYVYKFNGHLDPKDWKVEVQDGKLVVSGEESVKLNSGEDEVKKFGWTGKLSRYCASPEFEVEAGEYFPGIELKDVPGVYGKQHAGGTFVVKFPYKKVSAATA